MQRSNVEQKTRQVAAAPRSVGAEMAGYVNKVGRGSYAEAITGGGDLVADVANGRQKLSTVKDEDLPDAVRKLNAAERQTLIDKQMTQRKRFNERMTDLIRKRDGYVADARKKAPASTVSSFDRVVEETLRTQLKR